jgi:hypothetical protein
VLLRPPLKLLSDIGCEGVVNLIPDINMIPIHTYHLIQSV